MVNESMSESDKDSDLDVTESIIENQPHGGEQEREAGEKDSPQEREVQPKPDSGYIDFEVLPEEHRDKVRMRIDSDYRKLKEAERKAADAERKVREFERKLADQQKPKEVTAPTADDFIDDPEAALKKQNEHAEYIAKQKDWEYAKQKSEQLEKAEMAKESARIQNDLFQKAKSAGIDENELRYSAAVIMQSQISDEAANYLVEHDYAPQIINHLAKNPVEMEAIANLNPYQVGVKLNQIAETYQPRKRSSAPAPDDPIVGSGVDVSENPLLKGSKIY